MNANIADDKTRLKALRADIDALVGCLTEKYGLSSLKLGKCTYNSDGFVFKLEGVNTAGLSKTAREYEMVALYDKSLPPLQTEFRYGTENYRIVGMNSTDTKIIARRDDGKEYLFKRKFLVDYIAGRKVA